MLIRWLWGHAFRVGFLNLLSSLCVSAVPIRKLSSADDIDAQWEYKVLTDAWITMKDGVRLAVSYSYPVVDCVKDSSTSPQSFPVLFSYLPYRKDDSVYLRDAHDFHFFARAGYIVARVDIRGTGASEGYLVSHEYSEQELSDGEEVIAHLASLQLENGCVRSLGGVGMFGVSWGAFNGLLLAWRKPPALKTIIALHGSEDPFINDIHYLDGVYHQDEWILSVDHEGVIPSFKEMHADRPWWKSDASYWSERFDRRPWNMVYSKEQDPSSQFWKRTAVAHNYTDPPMIPMYLIGGLLDGYRDFTTRIREGVLRNHPNHPQIKVVIGPWTHAWPDESPVGPQYNGRKEAIRWFDTYLKNRTTSLREEPDYTLFVRDYLPPDKTLVETPGYWIGSPTFPLSTSAVELFRISSGGRLLKIPQSDNVKLNEKSLDYKATAGIELGCWWGDPSTDQRPYDKSSLVFDSSPFPKARTIVGNPTVSLHVSQNTTHANWVIRLEDVASDGSVSLITGGVHNSAQRFRNAGGDLSAVFPLGTFHTIKVELHFTTWTLRKGHRIRVAVANAGFRMIWPSANKMVATIVEGHEESFVEIPFVDDLVEGQALAPEFTRVPPSPEIPNVKPTDAYWYPNVGGYPRLESAVRHSQVDIAHTASQCDGSSVLHFLIQGKGGVPAAGKRAFECFISRLGQSESRTSMSFTQAFDYYSNVKNTLIGAFIVQRFTADDAHPENSSWNGVARQIYVFNVTQVSFTLSNGPNDAMTVPLSDIPKRISHDEELLELESQPLDGHIFTRWPWIRASPAPKWADYRVVEVETQVNITSDARYFYSSLTRRVWINGTELRSKTFLQRDERIFQ
ncbi:Alpha/Beta hydrolase protein [Cladochytrium replicatum]|nr:Alpha/Beta hydrolase protein [Cladochytrium replicatum]